MSWKLCENDISTKTGMKWWYFTLLVYKCLWHDIFAFKNWKIIKIAKVFQQLCEKTVSGWIDQSVKLKNDGRKTRKTERLGQGKGLIILGK